MCGAMSKFIIFATTLFFLNGQCRGSENGDNILGCGGFVKSKANIDYSKVEVRLITPSGIQKYQTECAPNNGYYMVPFIENGDFILNIQPPDGWIFEPSTVSIHVDGKNDPCSLGKDINFEFMGFSVKGQVKSLGLKSGGPAGVTLQLKSEDPTVPDAEVLSTGNGMFEFRVVLPGRYKIHASHKTFTFQQDEISVTVTDDRVQCAQPIIVSGYNVQGKVTAADRPAKDVHLLLFSSDKVNPQVKTCQKTPPKGSEDLLKLKGFHFVCSVASAGNGIFTFSNLRPSEYALVPFHKGKSIEFDVEPKLMKFTVSHGDIILPEVFKVTGFSVTGLVLDSSESKGRHVPGAEVFVDGKKQAVTDENGQYRLQSMTTGIYKISVIKEDFLFPTSTARIGPDTPRLSNIVAEKFSLCGRVLIKSEYLKAFDIKKIELHASSNTGEKIITNLDSNGNFCFLQSPGDYNLAVVVPGDSKDTLQFLPTLMKVALANSPKKDIEFQQYLADIQVSFTCIVGCTGVKTRIVKDGEPASSAIEKTVTDSSSIVFKNFLPGRYHIMSFHEQWCWDENQTTIDVGLQYKGKNSVAFKQTGFKLICSVSHDVDTVIYRREKPVNAFHLTKGKNELCVAEAGEYILKPKSCHIFNQEKYVFNTVNPRPMLLQAVAHVLTIRIVSDFKDPQLKIAVKSSSKEEDSVLSPELEKRNDAQEFNYILEYQATYTETLTVTPSSPILLFEPKIAEVFARSVSCDQDVAVFKAFKGLFIEGTISPPIKDVRMSIYRDEDIDSPIECFTDSSGHYKHGPVDPRLKYTTKAHKEGYAFIENANTKGNFQARKYSKISFSVGMNTEESLLPLKGVFITISGGSFRSNNLTDAQGNLVLFNLEPGKYYYKAVMKEYEFLPSSKVIELSEGEEMKIKITGKRVAFSCYGSIQSLNGQPESDVSIQAFDIATDGDHAEETKSDENGMFRIKGLFPNTDYRITVKPSDDFERFTPEHVTITVDEKDVTDLRFVAVRKQSQFEITGNVITDYNYHKSLKVVLYRKSDMNTPISTVSLNYSPFFQFSSLKRDHTEYQVVLETTLDRSKYTFTEPAAGFYAAGTYKHVVLEFHPQAKVLDTDQPQASYTTLSLGILVLLLVYNYSKVQAFFGTLFTRKSTANSETSKQSGKKSRKDK